MADPESERMIQCAKQYYANIEERLSEDRLQEINSITGLMAPAPEGGETRGYARTVGLQRLLESPNVYPVGEGSHEIRTCVQLYDLMPARFNHNGQPVTNGYLREMAIRKFWMVHDRMISDAVQDSFLALGKHVERTNNTQLLRCACISIMRSFLGESRASKGMKSFWKLGVYVENELAFYMMVLPLVEFFCTEMNPHMALDPRSILRLDLSRLENNMKTQLRDHGAWSEALVEYRLQLHHNHPQALTPADEGMLSGIEFHYLRFYTLFVKGVSLPWDQRLQMHTNLTITPQEKALLYVGYDNEWLYPRWPRPRQQGPNWYGF